jgi:hypothetical protein
MRDLQKSPHNVGSSVTLLDVSGCATGRGLLALRALSAYKQRR